MTDTLKHGPLTADMLPLLTAGKSVLNRDDGGLAVSGMVDGDWVDWSSLDGGTSGCRQAHRFTYIGELQNDGWIEAPEGGWSENPVPNLIIDVRWDGNESYNEPSNEGNYIFDSPRYPG